jgi:hypothetical protein
MVDSVWAQVDEITTSVLENREESVFCQRGIERAKGIPNRAIQSGILPVKEATGSGWGFADEHTDAVYEFHSLIIASFDENTSSAIKV